LDQEKSKNEILVQENETRGGKHVRNISIYDLIEKRKKKQSESNLLGGVPLTPESSNQILLSKSMKRPGENPNSNMSSNMLLIWQKNHQNLVKKMFSGGTTTNEKTIDSSKSIQRRPVKISQGNQYYASNEEHWSMWIQSFSKNNSSNVQLALRRHQEITNWQVISSYFKGSSNRDEPSPRYIGLHGSTFDNNTSESISYPQQVKHVGVSKPVNRLAKFGFATKAGMSGSHEKIN
jgi:hypothetical protein